MKIGLGAFSSEWVTGFRRNQWFVSSGIWNAEEDNDMRHIIAQLRGFISIHGRGGEE